VELTRLSPRALRAATEALRARQPVHLRLDARPTQGPPLDEIVPLCTTVSSPDPALAGWLRTLQAPPPSPCDAAVTAVIPTHQRVPLGLPALLAQDASVRVLIVSNGPGGPREAPGAAVLRLPWRGHGLTRQAAVAHVKTPYTLLTVDDAIPLGGGFVRTMVSALEAGRWDAVFARQIPWPDADPETKRRLRQWTPPGRAVVAAPQVDHVAALYRTESLRRWPLPDVPIAEDAWWSRGRRIGYVPMAPVLHSHARIPAALYARNRDIHTELIKMGEPARVPSTTSMLRSMPSTLRPLLRGERREALCRAAELLGQWQAARRVL